MIELEFSYIYDVQDDDRIWAALTEEFGAAEGVKIKLRRMNWDNAWAQLFSFTSAGNGPHVSHIGNTWVSSLARMNTLRAFRQSEIAEIGAAEEFMAPSWQTGTLSDDKRIWAIPWTAWIYVISYRKDLLREAGIEPAGAFGTLEAATGTVKRLTGSQLQVPWLNAQLPVAFRDLLHIASSWIWAAGGDFMDAEGTKALFNSPKAIEGLRNWLEIYRAVPERYKQLSQQETFDLFSEGRAAAVLGNIRGANTFIHLENNPDVVDNLGVASATQTPWTGGGSFVIWDNLHGYSEYERAAVNLVKFLSSREIQLRYCRETNNMPSRMDALNELYPQGNPAHDAIMLAARHGRGYYNMPIWRRVEVQLAEALGQSVADTAKNPAEDLGEILHRRLDILAERLNLTLEG